MPVKDPASTGGAAKKGTTRAKAVTLADVKKVVQEAVGTIKDKTEVPRKDFSNLWGFKWGMPLILLLLLGVIAVIVWQGCNGSGFQKDTAEDKLLKEKLLRIDSSLQQMKRQEAAKEVGYAQDQEALEESTDERRAVQSDGKKKD